MNFLKNLFGKPTGLKTFLNNGAVVIDVRTPREFSESHVKGSMNIPLSELQNNIEEIKKLERPVVTVCQSGMRSGKAKSFLQGKGITVMNGGSWSGLKNLAQ